MENEDQTFLGMAPVYEVSGELRVDTDAFRQDDGADFGEDDEDDDFGYEGEQTSGRFRDWRAKRKGKRADRKRGRADELDERSEELSEPRGGRGGRRGGRGSRGERGGRSQGSDVATILTGSGVSGAGAGLVEQVVITIRPQHDFTASDVSFTGSVAGAEVESIWFGEDRVFDSSGDGGVPIEFFAANSTLRGLLKGRRIRAGLDIKVECIAPAGAVKVQFPGRKV